MAPVTDLTWQQLSDALGNTNVIYIADPDNYHPNARVMIDVSALLNQSVTNNGAQGVIATLFKLHEACVAGQATINVGKGTGEKMASFIPSTYGPLTNNSVKVTSQMTCQSKIIPIGTSLITATNA